MSLISRLSMIPLIEVLECRRLMAVGLYMAEADGNSSLSGNQYAPVDFTTSDTLVSGGVTFHAMAGIQSTLGYSVLSGHASGVWSSFRNYAGGQVNEVWSDTATGMWVDGVYAYSATGGSNGAPLLVQPAAVQSGVRLMNNSWIGPAYVYGYSGSYSKTDLMARALDYWVYRDDVVMTSGAVGGGVNGNMMAWVGRNQLAVRGTQGLSLAGQTVRLHADLFGPGYGASSNTTPEVGGMAAKIIGNAQLAGNPDGQHHEVAKSIIMTSADKGGFGGSFSSWSRQIGNLDYLAGVGRAVASRADTIFGTGQKALTSLSSLVPGTTIDSPSIATSGSGWSYISSIGEGSQVAVIVQATSAFSDLNATLAWDVVPRLIGNNIDGGAENFANLNLRLYNVKEAGGVFTLGDALSGTGLASTTTNDNVEHLYYNGAVLPAGYYAFVIDYADTPNLENYLTDAGFSYLFNAPTGPGTTVASTVSPTSFNVTWSDNAATETSFRVEVATNSSFTQGLQTFNAPANATSYLVTDRTVGTTYYVRVTAVGSAMNSLPVTYTYNPAPFILSHQINDGLAQRSMVKSITLQFSETVTLTNALSLTRLGSVLTDTTLGIASTDQKTFTITFTGTDITGLSLPDGRYSFGVSAAGVVDAGTKAMASNYSFSFFRLFGDSDGDRDVDDADLKQFRAAFNKPVGTYWYFDYNNDSAINGADYQQFKSRLVRRVLLG